MFLIEDAIIVFNKLIEKNKTDPQKDAKLKIDLTKCYIFNEATHKGRELLEQPPFCFKPDISELRQQILELQSKFGKHMTATSLYYYAKCFEGNVEERLIIDILKIAIDLQESIINERSNKTSKQEQIPSKILNATHQLKPDAQTATAPIIDENWESKLSIELSKMYSLIGRVYGDLGQQKEGKECIMKSIDLGIDMEDLDQDEAFLGFHSIRYMDDFWKADQQLAADKIKETLQQIEQTEKIQPKINLMIHLIVLLVIDRRDKEAQEWIQQLSQVAETYFGKNSPRLGRFLFLLGTTLRSYQSECQELLHQQSIKILEACYPEKNHVLVGRVYFGVAMAKFLNTKVQESIHYFEQAHEIFMKTNNLYAARIPFNLYFLSQALAIQGQSSKGKEYIDSYLNCVDVSKFHGWRFGMLLLNKAGFCMDDGDSKGALEWLGKAEAILGDADNYQKNGIFEAKLLRSRIVGKHQKDYETAEKILKELVYDKNARSFQNTQCFAVCSLCALYYRKGDMEKVEECIQMLKDMMEDGKLSPYEIVLEEVRLNLVRFKVFLLENKEEYEKGLAFIEENKEFVESFGMKRPEFVNSIKKKQEKFKRKLLGDKDDETS